MSEPKGKWIFDLKFNNAKGMAPNSTQCERTSVLNTEETLLPDDRDVSGIVTVEKERPNQRKGFFEFETDLIWRNIIAIIVLHVVAIYCALTFDYLRDWRTTFFIYWTYIWSGTGVTGGAHRLWTHKAYKATLPLKLFLLGCYASAGQNKLYDWVRDHRVHHKYTDTAADPHNSKRGLFFSHVGWLMMRKNPQVIQKGREVDMTDILEDPVIVFFDKHFRYFKILCAFVLPTLVPVLFWNETWTRAFISQAIIRHVVTLNATWSVNSFAHFYGSKPYNKDIRPANNVLVSIFSAGEGWHNYHHVFPWDYATSEHSHLNFTKSFIDICSLFGLAYDRKIPPKELVKKIRLKKGDRSVHLWDEVSYHTLDEQ